MPESSECDVETAAHLGEEVAPDGLGGPPERERYGVAPPRTLLHVGMPSGGRVMEVEERPSAGVVPARSRSRKPRQGAELGEDVAELVGPDLVVQARDDPLLGPQPPRLLEGLAGCCLCRRVERHR